MGLDPFASRTREAAIRLTQTSATGMPDTLFARIAKHNPVLDVICMPDEAGARIRGLSVR